MGGVSEETTADYQDALVAKWGELPSGLEQRLGPEIRHRDLEHRDVGDWPHAHERDEGPVVEPSFRHLGDRLVRADQLSHAAGQSRCTGGRIDELVEALRKAPEVVDKRHGGRRRDAERGLLPMGETIRIASGRLKDPAQDASCPGQMGSSKSGGAPWPR